MMEDPESSSDSSTRASQVSLVESLLSEVKAHAAKGTGADEFMRTVAQRLDRVPAEVATQSSVTALLAVAGYYFGGGRELARGIEAAALAVKKARLTRTLGLLRPALTFQGSLCAHAGNSAAALESFDEALAVAQQINDEDGFTVVLLNIAAAALQSGAYRDAIKVLERVIARVKEGHGRSSLLGPAYGNVAFCHLCLEEDANVVAGLQAARRGMTQFRLATEPAMAGASVCEATYALLLLKLGKVQVATVRAAGARRSASRANSMQAEIQSSAVEGLCEVMRGNHTSGLARIEQAVEQARLVFEPGLQMALKVARDAYEIVGDAKKALAMQNESEERARQKWQEVALRNHFAHLKSIGVTLEIDQRTEGVVVRRRRELEGRIAQEELQKVERSASDNLRGMQELVKFLEQAAVDAEANEDPTGLHCYRVGRLAALIAEEFGFNEEVCFEIEIGGRLHDIGKLGMPVSLTSKTTRLTPEERKVMERHTTDGAALLGKCLVKLKVAEQIARHHHENWDGTGYPAGLAGNGIPVEARIVAVADTFDALTSTRVHRPAIGSERALEEVGRLSGTRFDPHFVTLLIRVVRRLKDEQPNVKDYLAEAGRASDYLKWRESISARIESGAGPKTGR